MRGEFSDPYLVEFVLMELGDGELTLNFIGYSKNQTF